MPILYANAHLLLKIGGHFGTSGSQQEQWSVGLRYALAQVPGDPDAQPELEYNTTKLTTFLTSALNELSSVHSVTGALTGTNAFVDWGTVARLDALGKYDPQSQVAIRRDQTPVAGTGAPVHAYSTALVISIRTAKLRGPASRGRCYWPATAAVVDPVTGLVSATNLNSRLAAFSAGLKAVNTAAGVYQTGLKLSVMSGLGPIGQGGGTTEAATKIRSDGRLDNIERRESNLSAPYQEASL